MESLTPQAQPKKLKIGPDEEDRYQRKMTLKAEIIIASANRLWGTSCHVLSRLVMPCYLFPQGRPRFLTTLPLRTLDGSKLTWNVSCRTEKEQDIEIETEL